MRLAVSEASSMTITNEIETVTLLARVSQPLLDDNSDCHACIRNQVIS